MPVLQIKTTPKIRWGPGTYKLNNSILRLNFVKDEIQYIWQIYQQSKIFFPDSNEWWEKGKQLLTNALKNLSIEVNKSHHKKTKNIKNKILELQVVFDLRPARLTTARLYDCFPGKARQPYQ